MHGSLSSRKTVTKTINLINSLKILEECDVDKCKYIVNKYLAKDEFVELNKKMTFIRI